MPLAPVTSYTPRDLEMFLTTGASPEVWAEFTVRRVSDPEARELLSINGRAGDMAGLEFPYFAPYSKGETPRRLASRVRRDRPEVEAGKFKDKYLSSYGDRRHLYFPPGSRELLADPTVPVILVEAEKSVIALTVWAQRTGRIILPLGLGGCCGWRGTIGKADGPHGERLDEKGPVPDLDYVNGHEAVICFDANARSNEKVRIARAALARELRSRKCRVRIADLPELEGVNGPDDYIGREGDEAMADVLDTAREPRQGRADPLQPSELEFHRAAATATSERRYVLRPKDTYDSWFRCGGIHLVGGSSGAGKSTLMLDLLNCQADQQNYLGHVGGGLRFLVVFADRPSSAVDETLERMRLVDRIPHVHLDVCWGLDAASRILGAIEEHDVPAVVFLEGADLLVEEPNKPQSVAPFLQMLQNIAQHYAVALILSVGAPKTKPGEGYALKRDRIFGSQIWPRMAETILIVSETADGARELDVLHRNAETEHFDLQFSNGLLVLRDPVSDEQARLERDVLWQWIARRGDRWFSRTEAVEAMDDADAGLSRTRVYARLQDWINEGRLESDGARGGKEYLRRRQT